MNLQELQDFLYKTNIPEEKTKIGFLEIAGKAHHENTNSAVYAHFMNSKNKVVRDLFLTALVELINEKTDRDFEIFDSFTSTEVSTNKNGRIDMLIEDRNSDQKVIIENKIYHHVHNDLLDYWDSVKGNSKSKIGILLTLEAHDIPTHVSDHYINITHQEWMQKIRTHPGLIDVDWKYLMYITDFINTINQLTKSYKMNETAEFYFENAEKVKQIKDTETAAHEFLNAQFNVIANELNWYNYGNSVNHKIFWDAPNELSTYLTLITADLLAGHLKYTLILELYGEDIQKENLLKTELENKEFDLSIYKTGEKNSHHSHFLMKDYTLSKEELKTFGEHVVQNIKKDFAKITLESIKFLYPETDLSEWKPYFEELSKTS